MATFGQRQFENQYWAISKYSITKIYIHIYLFFINIYIVLVLSLPSVNLQL